MSTFRSIGPANPETLASHRAVPPASALESCAHTWVAGKRVVGEKVSREPRFPRLPLRLLTCADLMPMLFGLVLVLVAAALPGAASANEFYGLGGIDTATDHNVGSYSWQLGYTQDLAPHVATSFCYLNEGHLGNHRRDGYSAQLWARSDLLEDRLNLGAGVGPYLTFDTQSTGTGFVNEHDWRALVSVAATWRTEGSLILLVRSNFVTGDGSPDTLSAMFGVGVEFRNEARDKSVELQRADNEITLLAGQTIVNSLDSQNSIATEIEYRRTLVPHLQWTVALLHEGDRSLLKREDGLVSQLWATQDLHHHRFGIGAGAGVYVDIDRNRHHGSRVSGIVGVTGSYRMTPHWGLRVIWDRVVTSYDRDSDIMLAGIGYRF